MSEFKALLLVEPAFSIQVHCTETWCCNILPTATEEWRTSWPQTYEYNYGTSLWQLCKRLG